MPLIAKAGAGEGTFTPVPEGSHVARCIGLYDIGTQYNERYDKWNPQCIVQWEIPGHTVETERGNMPLTISKFYSVYLTEKANLYKDLIAWRGKKFTDDELARFDLQNLLGKTCLLSVVHVGDKARVQAVAALPNGVTCPPAEHEQQVYDMADDPEGKRYLDLPEWIRNQIEKSRERAPLHDGDNRRPAPQETTVLQSSVEVDDVPFWQ